MATSTIKFYKVAFPENENVYIDIGKYLFTLSGYEIENFQYIKNDLEIEIKIDKTQADVNNFDYNYCKIKNSDETSIFYYFIRKVDQLSPHCLRVVLNMDTVNTLASQNNYCKPENFTDNTYIYRETEDRFYQTQASEDFEARRKISKTTEDFNFNKYKISDRNIDDKMNLDKWYIIYSTEGLGNTSKYTYSNDKISTVETLPSNSLIKIAICSDNKFNINDDGYGDIKLKSDQYSLDNGTTWTNYPLGSKYIWVPLTNPQDFCSVNRLSPNTSYYNRTFKYESGFGVNTFYKNGSYWDHYNIKYLVLDLVNNKILGSKTEYISSSTYKALRYGINEGQVYYNTIADRDLTGTQIDLSSSQVIASAKYIYYSTSINLDKSYKIVVDPAVSVGPEVKCIKDLDRTQSKLYKVVELPYCPVDVEKRTLSGVETYNFVGQWEIQETTSPADYLDGFLVYTDDTQNIQFERIGCLSTIIDELTKTFQSPDIHDLYSTTKNYNFESKLYNSQFYTFKLGYDSFVKDIKLENIGYTVGDTSRLNIDYKTSANLNSLFGFKLDFSKIDSSNLSSFEEDYYNYLIVNRNNFLPIYNSNYLDYMRNSFNWDIKSNALSNKQAVENSIINGSMATIGAAAYGAKSGGVAGAIIGGVSAAATSAFKSAFSLKQQKESQELEINRKISELSNQTLSVSDVDDVDMLDWYNSNKLKQFEYFVNNEDKERLQLYFRKFGYNVNQYRKPTPNTRVWFNYLQCDPEINFAGTKSLKLDWIADLKQKYNSGVTIYHAINDDEEQTYEFDLDKQYENWETWMVDYE